ncbi:DUF5957 family protein [Caldibacillus thermolactis]|jgi:hypothetical protein|uniref:DUF5957 family protein n=1 Tax=Pallidibacillus thermolactis TaxID=251051 RepID=A0ABT2WM10_9BACI|nr:DUF5957 family protein [Pallidibacillus thermolactis]MCU9595739.1 DUF5957 family protein [Pallidibacillus thermolactis]MCU9602181.1 DUF5957 family protein [Pallidibacillus thermolactis subsp. kokeshiiformis]MED1672592.1 DUF5957 family protein [Pallidibacillus thermolactis subsp. kokeshiiformis]
MRIFIAIIVGLLGGFILGVALSSFLGIFGMTMLNQPIGIKFLPYYTALLCAIVLPILEYRKVIKK